LSVARRFRSANRQSTKRFRIGLDGSVHTISLNPTDKKVVSHFEAQANLQRGCRWNERVVFRMVPSPADPQMIDSRKEVRLVQY